nr:toxin HicA [Yersinia frederiksenii]
MNNKITACVFLREVPLRDPIPNGSHRKFVLMGSVYQTHQPHPGNVMDKGAVNGLREWFENVIGVEHD